MLGRDRRQVNESELTRFASLNGSLPEPIALSAIFVVIPLGLVLMAYSLRRGHEKRRICSSEVQIERPGELGLRTHLLKAKKVTRAAWRKKP
jgi:hypothetical protein